MRRRTGAVNPALTASPNPRTLFPQPGMRKVEMRPALAQQHAIRTPGADRILESVAAASSAALVGLDGAGMIILWNPSAERMFG